MKIVIDIPEEVYKSIQDNDYCGISNADMYNAVKNGTPLDMAIRALKNEQTENPTKNIYSAIEYWKSVDEDNNMVKWLTELQKYRKVEREKAEKTVECKDMGEVSDGYHTFNQLYHQRAILFATIVNQNVDKSWKSFKHEDGKYCFDRNGEWFIVGVDTSEGSYTYHYEKKYWDYFKCKELETAKHWDGHTEEDVIRLLSLGDKNDL